MKNLQWWLMKIYRLSALVMFIAVVLYIVSGYGISKGIIEDQTARWLHLNFLPPVIILAFTGHVSLAIRITLTRWQIWNKFAAAALIIVFGALLAGFFYVEYFYVSGGETLRQQDRQRTNEQATDQPLEPMDFSESLTTAKQINLEQLKAFTAEELAKYNGLDGMPAYSAIDGVVYDLSAVFKVGMHNGNVAGKDQTEAFYGKHMAEILKKHPIVGRLAE